MERNGDTNFSTLEVVPDSIHQHNVFPYGTADEQEKYYVPSTTVDAKGGLEVVTYEHSGQGIEMAMVKEISKPPQYDSIDGIEISPLVGIGANGENAGDQVTPSKKVTRRKWLIIGGVVLLVVIIAAVVGGVVGSKHQTTTSTAIEAAEPSTSTASPSPSQSSTSAAASATALPYRRSIAAVGTVHNNQNLTRVYYQHNDTGELMETIPGATWKGGGLGFYPKRGSPLAAAISRPSYAFQIDVFYVDNSSVIQQISYSSSADWTLGTIGDKGYTISQNSDLAAMYNLCTKCTNSTLLAYQAPNGTISIANSTSGSWKSSPVNLNALNGTGLGFHPFLRPEYQDQVNLYYQQTNLSLSLAVWNPSGTKSGAATAWQPAYQSYQSISAAAPIAVASSYTNVTSGLETWIQLLAASSTGVAVNCWTGLSNGWKQMDAQPSVMSNQTKEGVSYSGVSVTSLGMAFGIQTEVGKSDMVQSWLLGSNALDWTSSYKEDI